MPIIYPFFVPVVQIAQPVEFAISTAPVRSDPACRDGLPRSPDSAAASCLRDQIKNQKTALHVFNPYFMFIEPCDLASSELVEEGIAPGCVGESAAGGNSPPTASRITGISCSWVTAITWASRRSCSLWPSYRAAYARSTS